MAGPLKRQSTKAQSAKLRAKTGPSRAYNLAAKVGKATPSARAMERASSQASFKRVGDLTSGPSKVRARPGTTVYKAKPKPMAPKAESPLDTIGREIGKRVDIMTGKTRTHISDAMKVTKTGPATWKVGK